MIDACLQEACDVIGRDIIIKLAQEVTSAKRKYPTFAHCHGEAVDIVESEFLEWKAQAMRVRSTPIFQAKRERAEGEGRHVLVTMLRYLKREYEGR